MATETKTHTPATPATPPVAPAGAQPTHFRIKQNMQHTWVKKGGRELSRVGQQYIADQVYPADAFLLSEFKKGTGTVAPWHGDFAAHHQHPAGCIPDGLPEQWTEDDAEGTEEVEEA